MEITHDKLLALGWVEVFNRPARYEYKGVTGRLYVEAGTFHFYGFGPAINTLSDLRYVLLLIDYHPQEMTELYPNYER